MYFCSSDLIIFCDYVLSLIKELVDDPFRVWDKHSYVNLRDAVVARITLFNARRGGGGGGHQDYFLVSGTMPVMVLG